MAIPADQSIKRMNTITDILTSTIKKIENGDLTTIEANSISRVAHQAIKAHSIGTVLVNQQEIQRSHIQLQYDRINERKERFK